MVQRRTPGAHAGDPANGPHVCALIRPGERVQDLQITLAGEGVERAERVILIIDPMDRDTIVGGLRDLGVDVAVAVRTGQLVLHDWNATFLRGGRFDPIAMVGLVKRWLTDGHDQAGGSCKRVLANMAWTLPGPPGSNRVATYEARVDEYLRRLPDVMFCIYDLHRHDAGTVADVLAHHPLTLVDGSHRPAAGSKAQSSARARILTAASDLFPAFGVRSTGVDSIIATAGVAKATFYRHFPSKDDLIVAWLEDPRSRWFDAVRSRAEATSAKPGDKIPLLFDGVADWLDADGFRGCPYLNTAVEFADPAHPVRPVIRRYLEEIEGCFTSLGADAGLAHPEMVAAEMQTLLTGAISLAVARRTSAFALWAREAAVSLIATAERA